jgi:hypothetical protein
MGSGNLWYINIDVMETRLNTPFVNAIDLPVRFLDIKKEVLDIIQRVGFKSNQIVCQTLEENSNDWHTGIGRIDLLEDKIEQNYCYLNTELIGTQLGNLIKHYNCFRTRIMLMPPRQCYSIHADPTPRLHLPIITNPQCWMVWPHNNECHRMSVGQLYFADTTKSHTFINGSEEDRIHVIFGVKKIGP